MSIQANLITTTDLEAVEERIKGHTDRKLRMFLEILQEGTTMTTDRCAEVMHCSNQTALKRLRKAGIKMNEDLRPKVVESKSFYQALWEGRIRS